MFSEKKKVVLEIEEIESLQEDEKREANPGEQRKEEEEYRGGRAQHGI